MAKANKFVHYNTRAAFDAHFTERSINPSAAEGNDLYYYTVYIKDTEEIYTHGKFYGDKGVEIDILALQNGDVEVGKALYQKLAERYATVPGRIIGHPVYKNPSAPNFAIHAPSMLIIFDYIDVINAFSGHHISVLNNDIKFNFMTLASTGECVFGDRTIVTEDMFHTGNKEGTIGLGTTDIPVKGLKSAAYVDVEDIIYTLDVAETDASVSLSDEEFETIVAHESINVVVNGKTYTSTHKNSFADGTIIQYECSFAHHDCVTDITITFDRNAKTYYCVKQDNDIYAQRADFATDLSGRVEATPELFTYRPSAGDKSIKDDNAFIRRVKGNSVVWNQLVDNNTLFIGERNGMVISKNEDGSITFNGTASADIYYNLVNLSIPIGHKVALTGVDNMSPFTFFLNGGIGNTLTSSGILTCSHIGTNGNGWMFLYITANTTFNNVTINPKIHYLTRMFGAGNEPTAEEFRALYPNSYYPYNTGELRNLSCFGIRTVGFNQWDGTTQAGYIRDANGVFVARSNYLCTDFIKIIPNQEYFIRTDQENARWAAWYDSDKNFISGISFYNPPYTSPENAAYIRLTIKENEDGNPDTFCINLHHTGYRDGEYEPYKEITHALPLSKITNGEPLRKAGSVYDEINETEYIKRVGVVDLGSLEWSINDASKKCFWSNGLDGAKLFGYSAQPNLTCVIDVLPFGEVNSGVEKFSITMHNAQKRIVVCAPNFEATEAGTASLKASLSGVLLQYELAEPIVTPIETPIDFNYYVEDFGTEEALLADDSAPFNADIIYQFNAVDRIRQNDLNIDRLEDKVLALPSEFKTINGNSIVGSGDLIITAGNVGTEDDAGGLDDVNTQTYLRYVEQSLTDEQKLQARINIGASSNIIIGNATQGTTSLQHNVLLKWAEDGTTESMFLEFPTNDGSTVLNCGFLLYLTPDATSDYSLYLDGIEIYWANNTTPDLEPEYYYEMWFTSYNGGATWFGVFTKYTM